MKDRNVREVRLVAERAIEGIRELPHGAELTAPLAVGVPIGTTGCPGRKGTRCLRKTFLLGAAALGSLCA